MRTMDKLPNAFCRPAFYCFRILVFIFLVTVFTSIPFAQRPATETFVETAEKNGTVAAMSLREVMKRALQNNLNVAIEDYKLEVFKQKILAAEHVYEPHLIAGVNYNSSDNPNRLAFDRSEVGKASTNKISNWYGRLLQDIPYGGSWRLDYDTNRWVVTPVTNNALFSPNFGGSLRFSFTQPLLRNLKNNPAFHTIILLKLDDKINETEFEEKVTNVVKQVQDLYWDLIFAINTQEIKKKSLELARMQWETNKKKVEFGSLAPIAITQASAAVAIREQEMIASENQINILQNTLKKALSNDPASSIWNLSIIPTEKPEFIDVQFDIQEAISTALRNRPELKRLRFSIEKDDVDYEFYKNQRKPLINFQSSFGTVGVAGDPVARFISVPVDPSVPPSIVDLSSGCSRCPVLPNPDFRMRTIPLAPGAFRGGLGLLNNQLFTAPFKNYAYGISVDIPFRNRAADAQLAQLALQKRQALKQLKEAEQAIVVEVRNALQAVEVNKRLVDTARVGLRLSQEQLEGEMKMFQTGISQNFLVLQRQTELAEAENRLTRALIDYRKSINELQRAMFVTLDQNDIEIAKTQVQP